VSVEYAGVGDIVTGRMVYSPIFDIFFLLIWYLLCHKLGE